MAVPRGSLISTAVRSSTSIRSKAGQSGSPVKAEPFEHLIEHIKQTDPMLYEALQRLTYLINNLTNSGAITNNPTTTPATTLPPLQRTLLLKDTTVGNDIADHVVVYGPGGPYTAQNVWGVLRKTITSDLTVRINATFGGTTTSLGTFTIPHTLAVNVAVVYTLSATLQHLTALSWDVTASDGSSDPDGIASFTISWE